jgi:DnaJ-class molecular chaperone
MKTVLQFENLRIVIRERTVFVEARCDWCGGHGIGSIDEIQIDRCEKCRGSGCEVLYTEDLGLDVEAMMQTER